MDCKPHKLYHVDDFDSRSLLDTYFSDKAKVIFGDDSLKFPMEKRHHLFSMGKMNGDILFDISFGPLIHHLHSACNFFRDIYLLRFNEKCIMELNRWLNTRTGAFDWNHATSYVTALEGNSNQCEDKEIRLKAAIKDIVKCDMEKENITDTVVLPQANCVISAWLLDVISTDHEDYLRNLRKILKLLKPGGCLILLGTLNATYYMIGQERFNLYKYDENYAKTVLTEEGFIIDHCDVLMKNFLSDLVDSEGTVFITAHKGN